MVSHLPGRSCWPCSRSRSRSRTTVEKGGCQLRAWHVPNRRSAQSACLASLPTVAPGYRATSSSSSSSTATRRRRERRRWPCRQGDAKPRAAPGTRRASTYEAARVAAAAGHAVQHEQHGGQAGGPVGAHRGAIKFARRKPHFRGLVGDQGRQLRRHKDVRAREALGRGRARGGGRLLHAQRDCAPILVTSAAPTVTVIVPHDSKKKVPNQVFIGNEGASGRARTQDDRPGPSAGRFGC